MAGESLSTSGAKGGSVRRKKKKNMTDTKHFSSEEWIDFVKGALAAKQAEPMQRHLETGCRRCSKLFETWNLVHQVGMRDVEYQVPESAVRHVKNAFDIAAEPQTKGGFFEIPRLVFDSFWQPALAGVRSSASGAPRHLLYKAGQISIELVLELETPSDRVHVTGQVSTVAAGDTLPPVPVVLSSGDRNVAEARTNRQGEFRIGFVPEQGLRLSFGSLMGRNLTIPLDGTGMRTFLQP